MYVCICNTVTDKQIRKAVGSGHIDSMASLQQQLKVGTCCGRCKDCAKKVLNDALAEQVCVEFDGLLAATA